ncbi:hypothetical protein M885DRAFT_621526 [Pelagophyceae sp. CCMP2097]|nr:hypothetical protein M885DRAFT_621526 [Pelagophyceae sp. CCMP2097]
MIRAPRLTPRGALDLLLRGPPPSTAVRCVGNASPPVRHDVFQSVRNELLERYLQRTPTAVRAIDFLNDRSLRCFNDHVALRSFVDSRGGSGADYLAGAFLAFGYSREASLAIPGLPVNAFWLEPPGETDWPKVFISELRSSELSLEVREVVYRHVDNCYKPLNWHSLTAEDMVRALDDVPWSITFAEERQLRSLGLGAAGEYAAWTLTHGSQWNHATLLANAMDGPPTLQALNAALVESGILLNSAGGDDGFTQGSVTSSLEQSSTLADAIEHEFACGTTHAVPGAFLELISRHGGFSAFLGSNARGIFDSTNVRNASK